MARLVDLRCCLRSDLPRSSKPSHSERRTETPKIHGFLTIRECSCRKKTATRSLQLYGPRRLRGPSTETLCHEGLVLDMPFSTVSASQIKVPHSTCRPKCRAATRALDYRRRLKSAIVSTAQETPLRNHDMFGRPAGLPEPARTIVPLTWRAY